MLTQNVSLCKLFSSDTSFTKYKDRRATGFTGAHHPRVGIVA